MTYDDDDFDDRYNYPNGGYDQGYDEGFRVAVRMRLDELTPDQLLEYARYVKNAELVRALNPDDNYGTEYVDEDGEFQMDFAEPGGTSALRAASRNNPRILPCPGCGQENALTPADRARGYQCDSCADQAEGLRAPSFATY